MKAATDPRKQRLARIHMGKKALGLSDPEYRALLMLSSADEYGLGGFDSAANMTEAQHLAVLRAMAAAGFKAERQAGKRGRWPGEPKDCDSRPLLRKLRALLAHGKKPWSYAHAMAAHMFEGVKRVEWLRDDQLHKLVAALEVDARRRSNA